MFNNLKPSHQEIIIDLLDDEEKKAELASQLFTAYRDGIEHHPLGEEKIIEYTPPCEEKADYYLGKYLLIRLPNHFLNQGITFFSWFTTLRLCELRINRYWTQAYSNPNFLPKNFTILQLSYFPETVFCIYKLVAHCFRPKKANESFLANRFEWERCKQILSDREFVATLSNAIIWLIVNSVCFFYYLGKLSIAACLWNLGGFLFDVIHDYLTAQKELTQYQELLRIPPLPAEEDSIHNIREKLTKKIFVLKIKKWRVTLVAIGIFIGMFLFYAPILFSMGSYPAIWKFFSWIAFLAPHHTHALIEQIKDVGAGILLIFGTIIGNLGGKIIKWEDKIADLFRSVWTGNAYKKAAAPFLFIWQVGKEIVSFLLESFKTVFWDEWELLFAGAFAIVLIYFGGIAAIPLIGNYIMGFGLPTVFTVTCLAIKNIIATLKNNTLRWCGISFELRKEELSEVKYEESTTAIIESLKRNKDKLETLQKSARLTRLSTPRLLKHIRNWGQENKENLSYNTAGDLVQAARQVRQISFFKKLPQNDPSVEPDLSRTFRAV